MNIQVDLIKRVLMLQDLGLFLKKMVVTSNFLFSEVGRKYNRVACLKLPCHVFQYCIPLS